MSDTNTETLPFTFAEAAERQHRYGSYYTVWYVHPSGERVYLGFTARRTGSGLLNLCKSATVQAKLSALIAEDVEWVKKTKDGINLSNGGKVWFGGTIRQEASEQGK